MTSDREPRSAIHLRAPTAELEATFLPGAGMLGWSLRHQGDEVVAHPVSLDGYLEHGRPTAIPLLHPWANRLRTPEYEIAGRRVTLDLSAPHVHTDPNGLAIHGLVAGASDWEVIEEDGSRLRARLDFATRPERLEGFPFPHVLELTAELLDDRLEITTELRPTTDQPVPIAFGFHPYLRLPGVEREQWLLELPVTSRMELDERMIPTGRSDPVRIEPAPLAKRTFDDAFDGLADPMEFSISGAGRRVWLKFTEGYRFAQVYTPAGGEFIAFEPMTAPVNPFESERTLLAAPGSKYVARFDVGVGTVGAR